MPHFQQQMTSNTQYTHLITTPTLCDRICTVIKKMKENGTFFIIKVLSDQTWGPKFRSPTHIFKNNY